MEEITLNQPFMIKHNLNSTEFVLYDYLKKCLDGRMDLEKILKELPFFFSKKNTIYKTYRSLINKGVLSASNFSDQQTFDWLNQDNSKEGCLFCSNIQDLHKHHYPIRKKDNGKDTIVLCKECHFKFHSLTDYNHTYKILKEITND